MRTSLVAFFAALSSTGQAFLPPACRPLRASPPLFAAGDDALIMTEENVEMVLQEAREKFGTIFGYSAENRQVGITGEVDLAYVDGPIVVISLSGRFWHERKTVLARVGTYLQQRIPEIIDVAIESPDQLDDADKVQNSGGGAFNF